MAEKKEKDTSSAVETVEEEKTVKIKIPITREEKDDVYVSVNDRTWLIQRGKEVEVPECVAEVLRHREEMLQYAFEFSESVANK